GRESACAVRGVVGLPAEAGLAAAARADPERGELRIAAVTTAAEQVVPAILGGFRREHPLTGIRLEAGNRDRVRSLLDRHQVDLVISGRPEPGWDVAVLAVRPHDLVVVGAPDPAVGAARAGGPAGPARPGGGGRPGRPGRRGRGGRAADLAGPADLAAA